MKKVTVSSILAAIVLFASCEKDYSDKNFQDIMKGRLFYTYAVDSIMEPWGNVIKAPGTKLANMRWRFKPDMTGIRYDSKDPYFVGMPEYVRFKIVQDENTMATFNFGGNKGVLDGITGKLIITQLDVPRTIWCRAVSDGNGMNGVE